MAEIIELENAKVVWKGGEVSKEVEKEVLAELKTLAKNIAATAKQMAPVDDGELKSKISVFRGRRRFFDTEPKPWIVSSGANHSHLMELGFRHEDTGEIVRRQFLYPAYLKHKDKAIGRMRNLIK